MTFFAYPTETGAITVAQTACPPDGAVEIAEADFCKVLARDFDHLEIVKGKLTIAPMAPSPAHTWTNGKWVLDSTKATALAQAERAALAASIDAAAASIYARYNQFALEYEEREKQAQAYKDASYAGTVPQQVAAFATPAGKTPQEATDIILAESATLRNALAQLGVLRMRKYEVLGAADAATAQAKASAIVAAIQQIGAALR